MDQVATVQVRAERGYRQGGSEDKGLEKEWRLCVSFIQQLL